MASHEITDDGGIIDDECLRLSQEHFCCQVLATYLAPSDSTSYSSADSPAGAGAGGGGLLVLHVTKLYGVAGFGFATGPYPAFGMGPAPCCLVSAS